MTSPVPSTTPHAGMSVARGVSGVARRASAWLPTFVVLAAFAAALAGPRLVGTAGEAPLDDAVRTVGLVSTASWVVLAVVARTVRPPRHAWVAAVVAAVQAGALLEPRLAAAAVAVWALALAVPPDGALLGVGRLGFAGLLAAGAAAVAVAAAPGSAAFAPALAALAALGALYVAACHLVLVNAHGGRADGSAHGPTGAGAGGRTRWALLWTGAATVIAVAAAAVGGAGSMLLDIPDDPAPAALAAWVLVPLAMAAGAHPRLARFGPRAFIEGVTVAGLAVLVAAVYLAVVLGLGRRPGAGEREILTLSLLAAFGCAVLALPARAWLAGVADRAVRGAEAPPDRLLATFGTRMTRAVPMDELLLQLTELLRATLGPAGAEIWTGGEGTLGRMVSLPERPADRLALGAREWSVVARARTGGNAWIRVWLPGLLAGDELVRVAPITHLGDLRGMLVVRRPATAGPFTPAEDRVLVELARQVGLALHNLSLDSALQASLEQLRERNAELLASRARIVTAADAARRRLERDLHDGAQQHLVGLSVKVGLAAQFAETNPAAVSPLLAGLQTDVRSAAAALRELAHGIYPPLLRDHGLAPALRAAAARGPLDCFVDADADRYPPDLEAAVYFCCLEALQNAGKYAGDDAEVTVSVTAEDGEIRFEVADDGAGFDPTTTAGHGFENMRDRVGSFGGTLQVESSPGAGTRVRGTLPLPAGAR